MIDWRECLVVRDRDGILWARTDGYGLGWVQLGKPYYEVQTEYLAEEDPMPVLDADGRPAGSCVKGARA